MVDSQIPQELPPSETTVPSASHVEPGCAASGTETGEKAAEVACPLCGQRDCKADQEWNQEERKRLEVYTQGQLEMVRLQREEFLKHRSDVEAALAMRGQEINRQIRQIAAQAAHLAAREKSLVQGEQQAHQREAMLVQRERDWAQRLEQFTHQQKECATAQAAIGVREQAAAEREAEIARREGELVTQQKLLATTQVELVRLQAEQEAMRQKALEICSEYERVHEAVETAQKQLASLEEEYSRRATVLIQRPEAPTRREPAAYLQEPLVPRQPMGAAATPTVPGIMRPKPAGGSAPGTSQTASAPAPAPASGSGPGVTRKPQEPPAAGSASGGTARPAAAPASGSAPGIFARPVAASGSALGLSRNSSTGSSAGNRTEDTRNAPRRRGNPVSVQITNDLRTAESWPGWVVDRSPDGLCLLADEATPVESILNVRPTKAGPSARWIQVIVRSCVSERNSWKLGCQFQTKLSWDDLQYFG